MRKKIHAAFWSKWGQAIFYFLLGILFAFLFAKTAFSPTEEKVKYNVPADAMSESKGF